MFTFWCDNAEDIVFCATIAVHFKDVWWINYFYIITQSYSWTSVIATLCNKSQIWSHKYFQVNDLFTTNFQLATPLRFIQLVVGFFFTLLHTFFAVVLHSCSGPIRVLSGSHNILITGTNKFCTNPMSAAVMRLLKLYAVKGKTQ